VSTPNTSGGAIHADGSPFELGEEVWLEMLDGVTDLRGVSITAMDENGNILYARSFPENVPDAIAERILEKDNWLMLPEGLILRWLSREDVEWFNYRDSPSDMPWDDSLTAETAVFPSVTFRWVPEEITAETENGTTLLISGMPIWNAYFADISGDSMPEICATATFGSGIIDSRIIVHDYMAGETYTLEDRGLFDYELRMDGDKLTAVQYEHNGEKVGIGTLEIIENEYGENMLTGIWTPVAAEPEPTATEIISGLDLDHDGKRAESVQFETVYPRQLYLLSVIREDSSLLWSKELGIPHSGWGTVLLYEREGKDYLISYDPRIFQGDGDYDCTLFSLEGGRENIIGAWSVDFDRVDFTKPMPISEEMRAFADSVNPLLMESTLLATTEQLELVLGPVPAKSVPRIYPVHFDPDEIQQVTMESAA